MMAPAAFKALAMALLLLTLPLLTSIGQDAPVMDEARRFTFEPNDREAIDGVACADLVPIRDMTLQAEGGAYEVTVTFHFDLLDVSQNESCSGASVDLKKLGTSTFQTIGSGYTDNDGTVAFYNISAGTYLARIEPDDDRWVRVADGSRSMDPNYYWNTQQFTVDSDRQMEYRISDENRGAWAVYRDLRDGASWLYEQTGWQRSKVPVVWPERDWPQSHGNVIYMPSDADFPDVIWRRDIALHEYAHCVHYALRGGSFPSGDGPASHYIDSESSPGFAFTEGWAQFFERAVDGDPVRYDSSSLESDVFADGPFGNGDHGDMDGAMVEGAVANLFWDIFDGVDPEDSIPGNEHGDMVDRQFYVLWDIMYREQPNDVNDIKRAWPVRDENVQAIFLNARIPMELDPPSNPTSFRSSHQLGEGSLDSTIYLRWLGAADLGSGVRGYSILINGLPSSAPDTVMDKNGNSLTTVSLSPGTYYVHIRTVDQDGNWAEEVYSIGPFIILEGAVPVDDPLIPEGDPAQALFGLVVVLGVVGLGFLLILLLDRRKARSAPPVQGMPRPPSCPNCGHLDQGGMFCPYCGSRLR